MFVADSWVLGQAFCGLVIFVSGWLLGRVASKTSELCEVARLRSVLHGQVIELNRMSDELDLCTKNITLAHQTIFRLQRELEEKESQ